MHSRSTDVAPDQGSTDQTGERAVATASHRVRNGNAVVLATTVGAAAVVTTALAPAAQATTYHTVWDRVARCESTCNRDINTGNGFYGGLQFTSGTWRAYGGGTYAGRADHAIRTEQIEVARRVLNSQGPRARPVCARRPG